VFFMKCQHLDQILEMECCFCHSFLWSDENDAKERTMHLRLEVEDKC
jgi:hypothetical protein